MLGQFLLQQGDYTGAAGNLRIAMEKDPLNPQHAVLLADAYRRQGKWRDAAGTLEHAVDLVPADSQYRQQLRDARRHAGIAVDAPIRSATTDIGRRPVMLRLIELTLGTVLAIAGVALVYPIVCGIVLALRTSVSLVTVGRA
jgi:cytochrome c-type biogenesis protein CcmH/NrfG